LYHLWRNLEKYGRDAQATDINITWRMRITCWINSATDTHSEYVICFTAAMSTRTRLIVMLYVLCLPCVSTSLYRYQKGFISEVGFFSLTIVSRLQLPNLQLQERKTVQYTGQWTVCSTEGNFPQNRPITKGQMTKHTWNFLPIWHCPVNGKHNF